MIKIIIQIYLPFCLNKILKDLKIHFCEKIIKSKRCKYNKKNRKMTKIYIYVYWRRITIIYLII